MSFLAPLEISGYENETYPCTPDLTVTRAWENDSLKRPDTILTGPCRQNQSS